MVAPIDLGKEALCVSDISHFHGRLRDRKSGTRWMGRCRDAGKRRWEMSGAFPWTTISEMELVAAVKALRPVPDRAHVELHSDSEYLIYGMRVFVFHWQRQGWRNRRGNQLQHRELWSELIALNTQLHIRWTWIKGHNGNLEQIRADRLAYQAARTVWVNRRPRPELAMTSHCDRRETLMASIAEATRCLKSTWNSMGCWRKFKSTSSPKDGLGRSACSIPTFLQSARREG